MWLSMACHTPKVLFEIMINAHSKQQLEMFPCTNQQREYKVIKRNHEKRACISKKVFIKIIFDDRLFVYFKVVMRLLASCCPLQFLVYIESWLPAEQKIVTLIGK